MNIIREDKPCGCDADAQVTIDGVILAHASSCSLATPCRYTFQVDGAWRGGTLAEYAGWWEEVQYSEAKEIAPTVTDANGDEHQVTAMSGSIDGDHWLHYALRANTTETVLGAIDLTAFTAATGFGSQGADSVVRLPSADRNELLGYLADTPGWTLSYTSGNGLQVWRHIEGATVRVPDAHRTSDDADLLLHQAATRITAFELDIHHRLGLTDALTRLRTLHNETLTKEAAHRISSPASQPDGGRVEHHFTGTAGMVVQARDLTHLSV